MGHVSGNPDIVHTAQDPAECACQRFRPLNPYAAIVKRLARDPAATSTETSPTASEHRDPDNRDG
jgi:hypothetical protein